MKDAIRHATDRPAFARNVGRLPRATVTFGGATAAPGCRSAALRQFNVCSWSWPCGGWSPITRRLPIPECLEDWICEDRGRKGPCATSRHLKEYYISQHWQYVVGWAKSLAEALPRAPAAVAILPTRSTLSGAHRVGKRAQELCATQVLSYARLPTLRRR